MTGFGKATSEVNGKKISLEIKSLNSRFNDVNIKTPIAFKEKELELRQIILSELHRGKIDCLITVEYDENAEASLLNEPLFRNYVKQLNKLCDETTLSKDGVLAAVMRVPQVTTPEKADVDDVEWNAIKGILKTAIDEINAFRNKEGENLEKDILHQISIIAKGKEEILKIAPERIDRVKESIEQHFKNYIKNEKVDKNRFEEELIYYLEKFDITEENIRLASHLNGFKEFLLEDGMLKGKKLNFYSQEIGREINTIGSKANHAEIQKIVVDMKDALEKIKEQLLNLV